MWKEAAEPEAVTADSKFDQCWPSVSLSELRHRWIWISSEGRIFWWRNQADSMVGLQDIICPSLKLETAKTEAATSEVTIDLRGLEDLLFGSAL